MAEILDLLRRAGTLVAAPDPALREILLLSLEVSLAALVAAAVIGIPIGTWLALTRYPETFAAAIPVAGGGDPGAVGDNKTPVWAFHGAADRVVPVRRSRAMFEAFRKAGANPRYTEYKGVRHLSWKRAFAEPGLLDWMFSQRRNGAQRPAISSSEFTDVASLGSQ